MTQKSEQITEQKQINKNGLARWLEKFFVRTFFSYMGVIVLVFLLIYFFSLAPIRDFYLEDLKTRLQQIGSTMQFKAIELYKAGDLTGLDHYIKQVGQNTTIRITLILPDGRVIADSLNAPEKMENHGDRPEVIRAFGGDNSDSIRYSPTMGEQMLYLALPINEKGETWLVVRLSVYLKEIRLLIDHLRWKLATLLLFLFFFAIGVSWFFSRGISKPVQNVIAAMQKFANGDFEARVYHIRKNELGGMAESFNKMAAQQKELFTGLSANQAELQAIIASMKEGLLVIDLHGKIVLCNQSFRHMIGKEIVPGCSYWEVLRIPDFERFVKLAFLGEKSDYRKLELFDKTYHVGFNRMVAEQKLVIIFRDITDFLLLDKMKKDFVVNLTHELKTPLTAIKGFVETLEEEEKIQHPEYIEIIKRHTARMTQLVSDMLVLSELEDMEETRRDIPFEMVELGELMNHMLSIFREKIKEKGVALVVDIPVDLPPICGERFKLEQMFINLLDNAVKYTDSGTITISIAPFKGPHEDSLIIQVKNSGIPIPAKSLSRIFERFYVVDKSRSRKMGGTGLGLSIVKHVVMLHKGEIIVASDPEQGTIFTIHLPRQQ